MIFNSEIKKIYGEKTKEEKSYNILNSYKLKKIFFKTLFDYQF